jgi:hypothetical protein
MNSVVELRITTMLQLQSVVLPSHTVTVQTLELANLPQLSALTPLLTPYAKSLEFVRLSALSQLSLPTHAAQLRALLVMQNANLTQLAVPRVGRSNSSSSSSSSGGGGGDGGGDVGALLNVTIVDNAALSRFDLSSLLDDSSAPLLASLLVRNNAQLTSIVLQNEDCAAIVDASSLNNSGRCANALVCNQTVNCISIEVAEI